MPPKTTRPGQSKKTIEEVVGYALNHKIRVHILLALTEGTYTAAQIAEIIEEPLNNVSNHIRELLDAGSIELAKTVPKGNVLQHYYRAVEMPYYSEEEAAAMTPEQRQVTAGLVVQPMLAEVMAALERDPHSASGHPGVELVQRRCARTRGHSGRARKVLETGGRD